MGGKPILNDKKVIKELVRTYDIIREKTTELKDAYTGLCLALNFEYNNSEICGDETIVLHDGYDIDGVIGIINETFSSLIPREYIKYVINQVFLPNGEMVISKRDIIK